MIWEISIFIQTTQLEVPLNSIKSSQVSISSSMLIFAPSEYKDTASKNTHFMDDSGNIQG